MVEFLSLKKVTAKYADEIHEAVNRVVDSGWYLQGEENKRFEENYAKYIGARHCVGCANGLDALIWIFRAYIEMGVMAPGDEIIVPANTYIASILAITENGLKPVLVEPKFESLEIDADRIEEKINSRTRAILIVHLYGRLAWSEKIAQLCKDYDLKLIEDNAQAQGCKVTKETAGKFAGLSGRRTGALGDAAGHSFYPGKNIGALGDGGAVTTSDEELAKTVRALANYGSQKKYIFKYCGRNSRLDEIHAAVLDVKLKHLDEDNDARRVVANYYQQNISNSLVSLPAILPTEENVFHQFPIFTNRRNELQAYLKEKGIGTMIHYPIPPHKQECYKDWNDMSFPITERIHDQELSLPISQILTLEEAEEIVKAINSFK